MCGVEPDTFPHHLVVSPWGSKRLNVISLPRQDPLSGKEGPGDPTTVFFGEDIYRLRLKLV